MSDTTEASIGGVRITKNLSKETFYGFSLDHMTGNLNIEIIGQGVGVVRLPQPDVIDPTDYKQWIFTEETLQFRFNTTNGHLEMTIL